MGTIFWFSAQPSEESSQISGGLTEQAIAAFLPQFESWDPGLQQTVYHAVEVLVRKSAHFSVYALLGFLCMFAASRFIKFRRWQLLTAFAVSVLYAVSDELHQLFVPGRSCEFRDVCIDAGGALLGILLMWLVLAAAARIQGRRGGEMRLLVDSVRRSQQ